MSDEEAQTKMSDEEAQTKMPTNKGLSFISKKYDHGGKGYLDDTEKRLREMDSQDLGFLDTDKVYRIMKELQDEQRKSMSLRKLVYVLASFSVLLALANIGTSFAAARLAKDTKLTNGDMVDKSNGERVGTTSRTSIVQAEADDSDSSRLLGATATGTSSTKLKLTSTQADGIMKELCTGWPLLSQWKGAAVACGCGAQETVLGHCGYTTTLTYSAPSLSGNVVTLTFNGYRKGRSVGYVTIKCDKSKLQNGCTISGVTCAEYCYLDGSTYSWYCGGTTAYCGCDNSTCTTTTSYCPGPNIFIGAPT